MGFRRAMMMASNYVRSVIQNFIIRISYSNAEYEADYCLERNLDDLNEKDLLYNASLVVTPNSYNEGFLYATLPNSSLGNIDFSRSSLASRRNSLGIVEIVPSENLLITSATFPTQSVNVNSGGTYTLSFYGVGSISLTGVYIDSLSGTGVNDRVSLTFTVSVGGTLTLTKSGTVTLGQLTQTSTTQPYFPTTNRFNIPRLNYDVDDSCPLLLIESSSTNLYINSPILTTQTNTVSNTTNFNNYTVSFYGTGSITLTGAYIGSLSGTGVNDRVSVSFTAATTSLVSTVVGSVLNAQLENMSIPTSYIETSGVTTTRSGDVLTLGDLVTNNLFNSLSGGTFFIECSGNYGSGLTNSDAQVNVVSFLSPTIQFRLRYSTTFYPEDRLNDISMFDPGSISSPNQIKKTVLTIVGNDVKMWQNGIPSETFIGSGIYTYSFTPITLSQITSITISVQRNQAKIKKIALYNQVLTDEQCIKLSTM